jgi:hypothetical protein
MYGALQGKNKSETAAKYGEDQVKVGLFISNKQQEECFLLIDLATCL